MLRNMEDLDQRWMEYASVTRQDVKSDKPFFLAYGTRGCHFDIRTPTMRLSGASYGDCGR